MTKQLKPLNLEHLLYACAFLLALAIRFANLGAAPLSDFEAGFALQSWSAVQGELVEVGSNPAYFSLTSLLFYLLGSGNALARFWPALTGSMVVLAPFGLRNWLGRVAALVMAFGLALDPGMVALSRLAGGPMMAVGFSALLIVSIFLRKPVMTGILAGLAITSGPSAFMGLTIYLLTIAVARLAGVGVFGGDSGFQEMVESFKKHLRTSVVFCLVTVVLTSTLVFRFPIGLGSWGKSIADYFLGWLATPTVPIFQPLLAVVTYQPLALVFAAIMAVKGWFRGEGKAKWLSIGAFVAMLITLLYSGRNVFDAAWVLLLLWALASMEIVSYLRVPKPSLVAWGQAGIVFVLGVMFWLVSLGPQSDTYSWLILVALPLLAIFTSILVGLGWSWDAARSGSMWGVAALMGIYILAATFNASQVEPNSPRELWTPSPGPGQVALLENTLRDLAIIHSGQEDSIQIVTTMSSPSLDWMLKRFSQVTLVTSLTAGIDTPIIITPEDGSDLSQTMAYRGQDFLWTAYPGWAGPLPPWNQLWRWVTSREAPVYHESLVLWGRADLFPQQPTEDESKTVSTPPEDEVFIPGIDIEE